MSKRHHRRISAKMNRMPKETNIPNIECKEEQTCKAERHRDSERQRDREKEGRGDEKWHGIAFNSLKWKFISVLYSQCKFSMLFDVCYCFRLRLFLSSFLAQSAICSSRLAFTCYLSDFYVFFRWHSCSCMVRFDVQRSTINFVCAFVNL